MNWWKRVPNWKLIWAVALLFMLGGYEAPHVEPYVPDFIPSTTVELRVSGGQVANVHAEFVSHNFTVWNSR